MGQLTIEQKARRYDDALKVTKNLVGAGLVYEDAAVQIFPELKESEDERIRKFIANELICLRAAFDKGDCRYEELSNAINWLEKHEDCQKKINHAYAKGLADAQKALKKQCECHISHDDEIMIKQLTEYFTTGHGLQNTNGTVVEWFNDVEEKLEKQGKKEVKSTEEFETFVRWFVKQRTDNYTLIPSEEDIRKWADLILSHAKQELEKQGEQILANSAKTCKDEQKPNPCDECVNRKGCINCENGELREIEQKPIDKVMEVNELMIGDLVRVTNGIARIHDIGNIVGVEFIDGGYDVFKIEELEPISLTSEILEKIGFVANKHVYPYPYYEYIDKENEIKIGFAFPQGNKTSYKEPWIYIDTKYVYIEHLPCVFVHQLQHALKLCGIDKTIEL